MHNEVNLVSTWKLVATFVHEYMMSLGEYRLLEEMHWVYRKF